ncbi:glycerol-3-phosphate 1-O-acyltransferase PlsY [Natroniella sulfidigena]|uniref:glycerol-3-phosphate 1-O-acyltransferase PlsY n=1 Tax=Natroniella sulfidigena TaxID=723921 RepID=UPI00200B0AD8|nr:glycerol-3-phosphate 1-O-acyltransferase PlsY [Natroniella sulfidigena]MCK8817748.1 glycerol-3-phosphate 1-O-acyltransferase PlsY [Natroniella sulfidigena]
MVRLVLAMGNSYLLGSIPFGLLVAKFVKGVDIRKYGSGNIGATNAYRIMGLGMGILVALLDIGKGFLGVTIASRLFQGEPFLILLIGVMAIVGHNWSLFLKFTGGRGVATSVGVLISLAPGAILIVFIVWVLIVATTKYVSLGSIVGATLIPIMMFLFNKPTVYVLFGLLIAIFVLYGHKPNIKRLLAGTENKITQSKVKKKD